MAENFKNWIAQPFSADMDTAHWFYFIGLLLAIVVLWGMVLNIMREGISE